MQLHVEHTLAFPLGVVERALLGPRAIAQLPRHTPTIATTRSIYRKEGPDFVERAAHVRAVRMPAPLGPLLPRSFSGWIVRLRWDLRSHAGTFVIDPGLPPAMRRAVRCEGTYALHAEGPDATVRQVRGELTIRLALLGRWAERGLAGLVREQLAGEAAMLAALAAEDLDES